MLWGARCSVLGARASPSGSGVWRAAYDEVHVGNLVEKTNAVAVALARCLFSCGDGVHGVLFLL